MKLYFEKYKDTCFKPEELFSFKEVLQHYETIHDTELIELIKHYNVRLFDIVRPVMDPETGAGQVFCSEVDINSLDEDYKIKSKKMLRREIENLAAEEPRLKWKNHRAFDSVKAESEIDRLKQEVEHLTKANRVLQAEIDEHLKKSATAGALDGKAEKTAERWAGHLETAVRLAIHCFQEAKKYNEDELQELCEQKFGGKLAREALVAFKKGMPDDLLHGRGRSAAT